MTDFQNERVDDGYWTLVRRLAQRGTAGLDAIGTILAAVMTLGPLAATAYFGGTY